MPSSHQSATTESHPSSVDARRLTDQIKDVATFGAKEIAKSLIEAVRMRAWELLDYPDCAKYLLQEMGEVPLRLTVKDRSEVFCVMRLEGAMSLRDIAVVTGYSKDTVQRAVSNETPCGPARTSNRRGPSATAKFMARYRKRLTELSSSATLSEVVALGLDQEVNREIGSAIKSLEEMRTALNRTLKQRQAAELQAMRDKQLQGGTKAVRVTTDQRVDLDG